MNSTPEPQTADYDGCNRKCRLAAAHTLVWGECEHGVEPEPTVSLSRVYTAADGFPAIGFDSYTVAALADLIEPALRRVHARLGPNALAMLHRGETVSLSGGEYADLAREAAHAIVHRNAAAAVSVAVPPTQERRDRYAALAEDLRYVLGYTGPRHAHAKPGVWDTSGKPCGHCARLAVAQRNLATYDADPVADAEQAALRTRVACLATALGEAVQHVGGPGGEVSLQTFERWRAVRDAQPDDGQTDVRAAVYRQLADRQTQLAVADDLERRRDLAAARRQLVKELRRMAAEAQQQPEPCPNCRGSGLDPRHNGEFACPDCTGDAATAPAVVSQPDEEATRCSTPTACDAETGEPCERHEREQSHADNDHSLCRRADCEVLRQT